MKSFFLLVIIALLRFSANASGQPLVSLHLKNVEISQVISTLEKESGYHFLFIAGQKIFISWWTST